MNREEIKKQSERKHLRVYKYLRKIFNDCKVKYNGLIGHDVYIEHDEKKIWVEIKTCQKIVCNHNQRLGRIKFDRRQLYPYEISQHDDLIQKDGWYLFFVGDTLGMDKILFGIKAEDVPLTNDCRLQQINWGKLSTIARPDWLEQLKIDVRRGNDEMSKLQGRGNR